jgi:glycosyltransferase involved in cell wall biosynthesis
LSAFDADVVYSVWWKKLLTPKGLLKSLLPNTKTVATLTNDIKDKRREIRVLERRCDIVAFANEEQRKHLLNFGFPPDRMFYCPFYVDETIFKPMERATASELLNIIEIDWPSSRPSVVLGSFQRDSLGSNLQLPKWQKNPDLLLEICQQMKRDFDILLVLAGPRRHYVLQKCTELDIPTLYVGDKTPIAQLQDDIYYNVLPSHILSFLYNYIDIYIVTSASEGGPKGILESALCGTPVISTNVGWAPDFLHPFCLYGDAAEALDCIKTLMARPAFNQEISDHNRQKALNKNSFERYKERVAQIIEGSR